MNYTEIIEDIRAGLSGDPEKARDDLKYLEKQAFKYRTHQLAQQIIDEISKIAYEILPQEKRDEVQKALFYNGRRLDEIFREAKIAADIHEYRRADKLMKGITETIDKYYKNSADRTYVSLRNPLEEHLYYALFNPPVRHYKPPFDFSEMYRFIGFLLIETDKTHVAITALEKALTYNPLNSDAYFELCEAYKLAGNTEALLYCIKDTLKIAVSSQVLSRCYKNLGYYCIEAGDYTSAICFYYQAMKCFDDPTIVGELASIREKSGVDIPIPSSAEIEGAFKKYNVKLGANDMVVSVAFHLAKALIDKNEAPFAKYCLKIVCDLTDDDDAKELLEKLNEN